MKKKEKVLILWSHFFEPKYPYGDIFSVVLWKPNFFKTKNTSLQFVCSKYLGYFTCQEFIFEYIFCKQHRHGETISVERVRALMCVCACMCVCPNYSVPELRS